MVAKAVVTTKKIDKANLQTTNHPSSIIKSTPIRSAKRRTQGEHQHPFDPPAGGLRDNNHHPSTPLWASISTPRLRSGQAIELRIKN